MKIFKALLSLSLVFVDRFKYTVLAQSTEISNSERIAQLEKIIASQNDFISNLPLSAEQIYANAAPAICKIQTICSDQNGKTESEFLSSCVIVSPHFALTAYHSISTDCKTTRKQSILIGKNNPSFDTKMLNDQFEIVHQDANNDWAIIRLSFAYSIHLAVEFNTKPGTSTYTLGYSRGDLFISPGMIGSVKEEELRLTGHSLPGDSGGAVLNSKGALIGVSRGAKHKHLSHTKEYEKMYDIATPLRLMKNALENLIRSNDYLIHLLSKNEWYPTSKNLKIQLKLNPNIDLPFFRLDEKACQDLMFIFKSLDGCAGIIKVEDGTNIVLTKYRGNRLSSTENLENQINLDMEKSSCAFIESVRL